MHSDCERCKELWRQYGVASMIHVQLENKLRLSALKNELKHFESLTRETEGAEIVRTQLRDAIRQHEESHRISVTRSATVGYRA
jgi:hypothetical protein